MNVMLVSIGLAAAWSLSPLTPALAQSDSNMLAPGVYTTPEISRKCQDYTRERVGQSSSGDSERQSVFLACVQKLYSEEFGTAPVRGTR